MNVAALILATLIAFLSIYFKISNNYLNVIFALSLVSLIFLLNKYARIAEENIIKRFFAFLILLFSSTFVTTFVISSGGFYSPFLILIHLYTLTLGLFLDTKNSLLYLGLAFSLLVLNVKLNPNLYAKFLEDPWVLILYVISFVVIIPVSHSISRTYHLKSIISEKLKNIALIGKSREESIVSSLDELVVVTDTNLKILSVNNALEQSLKIRGGTLTKDLLDQVYLKDANGNPATRETLQIDQILKDNATRIINDFTLVIPSRVSPLEVVLQIRPISDIEGKIDQLVFVIFDKSKRQVEGSASEIQNLRVKNRGLYLEIMKTLGGISNPKLKLEIELLNKWQEDSLIIQELESKPIEKKATFENIAAISKSIALERAAFSKDLNITTTFIDPTDPTEKAALSLFEDKTLREIAVSVFQAPIDLKWFKVMVTSLIDIATFLAYSNQFGTVTVEAKDLDKDFLEIEIISSFYSPKLKMEDLFKLFFGELGDKTGLKFASGVEGVIVQTIAKQLDITVETKILDDKKQTAFEVKISKAPKSNN